jgi:hypothetical protein
VSSLRAFFAKGRDFKTKRLLAVRRMGVLDVWATSARDLIPADKESSYPVSVASALAHLAAQKPPSPDS